MTPRHLSAQLLLDATRYPVVTLTGPRQSGKTTLARATFPEHAYVSLETPDERSFALEDPRGFLARFPDPVVLDEAQRAPELFSYIQGIVDDEDRAGRFVLTGSQNFLLLRSVRQTLAGRCAIRHLLPLSLDELLRRAPLDPFQLGERSTAASAAGDLSLFDHLFTGGYPRIHDKGLPPQDWLANYYQSYLERDVRDILDVGDLETFGRFVRLCAGRTGQLLNLSSLGADAGVSHPTARRWLSVLEASFQVALLRPHHRNFNKRLVKTPKLHFLDTGLLCYLLRIHSPEDLRAHAARGAIFESYVVSELLKRAHHLARDPDLFFWRTSAGLEIDLLLDRGATQLPVEVKSGQTVASDWLRALDAWRRLTGDPSGPAALVYGGETSQQRHGVAIRAWWDF